MKCSKCQFENPGGKKFCGQCGAKMERICPDCHASNPPQFKFCGECGHNLTEPTETIKKALALDSERKHATVLFSDLVGYTAMTEKLDPEDVKEIMSRIFGEIAQVVTKYEGFIERFFGDEVMVLFGVPKAHEDDPVRAIRAAREIHRVVEGISPEYETEIGHPLAMHTGINTGLLITGDEYIGKGRHGLTGDVVNLAARLAKLAQAGETLVGQDTYRHAEGYFIFEHLEPKTVKGKEKPVKAYQVIASSTRRTRFEVSAERGLTPLVGRGRDLEQLLDGFERCKAGRGEAFSIVSEAGLGKSRLLYEFRKAVAKEEVIFLEGKCLSYSKGAAYQPVIDILKSTFDIMEADGGSEIREKVIKGLKVLGADETSILPYLLELLSVKDSGLDRFSMSSEGKKDRIMEALMRIVLKGSEMRPLIMAIEDLHWIDKSSEDAFKDLLDILSGARIFLILTYRPEYVPTWGVKSYHSQINLNRLSEGESLSMVTHLLGTADIDRALEELITGKTEGAPFFIEEFIKSMKDLGIIEKRDKYYLAKNIKGVAIPSTIQDVIMARVDALPEDAKEVLQTGSVIEREFSYELIKYVMDLPEQEFLSHLSGLRDSELIYERGIFPQSTYIFKHALTRDVVYDSVLIKRRKHLHEQVGDAIEVLYKDNINEHYEVLAEHYIASENYEKAAAYSKLAAKKAEKKASLNDAISYAKKRVASIEKLPQTDEVEKQLIDARTIFGLYTAQLNHFTEAKKAIDPIVDLAVKHDHKRRLSQIYTILGAYDQFVGDNYHEAKKHLNKAIRISEHIGDIVSFLLGSYWMGCLVSWNCEFEKAYSHLNKSIEINEAANNLWGIAAMKSTLGMSYYWNGKIDFAYKISNEAMQTAEESGDLYPKALSYTDHGISCFGKGYFQSAVKHLLKAVDFCVRAGNPLWDAISRFNLGDAYFELGEYRASQSYNDEAVDILEQYDLMPSFSNLCRIASTKAKVRDNEKDIDLESVFQYHEENRDRIFDGWTAAYIADILLNMDEHHVSEAEEWVKKATESDRSNGMMFHLGRDYALYADLFKRKGDKPKARQNLSKAIEILKDCGADGWVEKYEEEMAALS